VTTHDFLERLRGVDLVARTGRVRKILPTYVEADGPCVPLGSLCAIETTPAAGGGPSASTLAEVVSVNRDSVILAPFEEGAPTFSGARVTACAQANAVPVGDAFLGRAVDALARPLDGRRPVRADRQHLLERPATSPLERDTPRRVLETGVRAIDGLLTLGHGQRVGVFAASGVGKTSLMTQLANQVEADRCVICLVGERGREVEALWSRDLSAKAKARSTLVAATSDQAAAMRVRAAEYALALADHWRQQGRHVLLLLDSVTRLAMAMREIGLAAGEPPTVRAYTPSVFAAIPKMVEQCGALKAGGSITAIMTVLSETDEVDDPISEMMRSLLDGHIILSRGLAEQGHFPAIDVPRSVSRLAGDLTDGRRRASAGKASALLSVYESARTLIETGVYIRGSNVEIDHALDRRPSIIEFLKQAQDERTPYEACTQALNNLIPAGA